MPSPAETQLATKTDSTYSPAEIVADQACLTAYQFAAHSAEGTFGAPPRNAKRAVAWAEVAMAVSVLTGNIETVKAAELAYNNAKAAVEHSTDRA